MIFLAKSIEVAAAPARVFAFLARLSALPQWQPGVRRAFIADRVHGADESASLPGELAPGAHFETVTESLGVRFESRAVVTEARAPRKLAWRQTRGDYCALASSWTLDETETGSTRVSLRIEVEYPFVLPRPRITTEREIKQELSFRADTALVNMKRMVEADTGLAFEKLSRRSFHEPSATA